VPQVKLPKRLNLDGDTERALDSVPGLIAMAFLLNRPAVLTRKTLGGQYNNHVMQFLADRVYSDPAGRITVQDLYDDYCHWFVSTGLRGQLGRKQFANRIEAAGVGKSSRQSAGYFFEKVSLR
jgi:hypothetical protein|tara:strand:- start:718 stop:1086 length:369 start_codon:yes stop_codon:yes gene_type:complete